VQGAFETNEEGVAAMVHLPGGSKAQLEPQELVVDVAVGGHGVELPDQLGHTEVAAQLARLALEAPMPCNIALFGPWGSGKTGICNMLEARVKQAGVKFARVDAFKHAEVPLRREFLAAVAKELGSDSENELKGLFDTEQKNRVEFNLRHYLPVVGALMVVLLIAALSCALAAWLPGGNFRRQFASYFVLRALPLAMAPAIVAGLLAATLGKTITVQSTRVAPSANDEFERIFNRVIDAAHKPRVVIFVDELDRCAPDEVTSTLDAIRTFLGNDKCVFVVAADQHVLETALRKASRQTTPLNETDPYYSSGAGYLDKLFGFQLHVPPAPPRRLTQYALGLVEDKHGLWDTLERDRVITALVPTHIRSPRRVKALINAFVLHYRVCLERLCAGDASSLAPRAQEVAKWCALRTEFPNFARDCSHDHRLLEVASQRALNSGWEPPPTYPTALVKRVEAYFSGTAAVDELVHVPDTEDGSAQSEHKVREVQGSQLEEYLRKTHKVPGPRADIIQLESQGEAFGLPAEEAAELERAAVDSNAELVAATVDRLPEHLRPKAVQLLVQVLREANGLEEENVGLCLLSLIDAQPELLSADVALRVAGAVSASGLVDLAGPARRGAYRVATLLPDSDDGQDLLDAALPDDEAQDPEQDQAAFGKLLIEQAPAWARRRLSWRRAAAEVLFTDEAALDALIALAGEARACVLRDLVFDLADAAVLPPPEPDPSAAEPAVRPRKPDADDERVASLSRIAEMLGNDPESQACVLMALVGLDERVQNVAPGTAVFDLLGTRVIPMPAAATPQLLTRVETRWPLEWSVWLGALAPGSVTEGQLAKLQKTLVRHAMNPKLANPDSTRQAVGALHDLSDVHGLPAMAAEVRSVLLPVVTVDPAEQERLLRTGTALVTLLVEESALSSDDAADIVVEAAAHALTSLGRVDMPDWLEQALDRSLLSHAGVDGVREVAAALASSGLEAELSNELRLRCACRLRLLGECAEAPIPYALLLDLRTTDAGRAARMAADWFEAFLDEGDVVSDVVAYFNGPLQASDDVDAALRRLVGRVDAENGRQLLGGLIALGPQMPRRETLQAVAEPLTPQAVADVLVAVAGQAGGPSGKDVVEAWSRLDVTNKAAAGSLVKQVWTPLLSTAEGVQEASQRLSLLKMASSPIQKAAVDALVERAQKWGLLSGVQPALEKAGYMTRTRRMWFLDQFKRVDLPPDSAEPVPPPPPPAAPPGASEDPSA
jgi:hypothetical protein